MEVNIYFPVSENVNWFMSALACSGIITKPVIEVKVSKILEAFLNYWNLSKSLLQAAFLGRYR